MIEYETYKALCMVKKQLYNWAPGQFVAKWEQSENQTVKDLPTKLFFLWQVSQMTKLF